MVTSTRHCKHETLLEFLEIENNWRGGYELTY